MADKTFDAIAFKDQMQRRAEKGLEGLTPLDRLRRTRQELQRGPLGAWWSSLRRPVRHSRP